MTARPFVADFGYGYALCSVCLRGDGADRKLGEGYERRLTLTSYLGRFAVACHRAFDSPSRSGLSSRSLLHRGLSCFWDLARISPASRTASSHCSSFSFAVISIASGEIGFLTAGFRSFLGSS